MPFLFPPEDTPTRSCHAATIVEAGDTLIAAWFAGTAEGHKDVGIWTAALSKAGWTTPRKILTGAEETGQEHPCWNPVLTALPDGELLLFYKVGPNPRDWWGMLSRSHDGGTTWESPERLPDGILGPIKNKPFQLPDGTLLCPSSTEHQGWHMHFERSSDRGRTWTRSESIKDPAGLGAIQPTILQHSCGRLQALARTRKRVIAQAWSDDGGCSWRPLIPTTLPNPNSGIDAVTLNDRRHVLVFNPSKWRRSPLSLAISGDGTHWAAIKMFASGRGEYSYPAVIQSSSGLVHVLYTWHRRNIAHAVYDPKALTAKRPAPERLAV